LYSAVQVQKRRLRDQTIVPIMKAPSEPGDLQILLFAAAQPPLVVNIPSVLRTAHALAAARPASRIILCTQGPGFADAWRACLGELRWTETPAENKGRALSCALDPGSSVLVLEPDGVPDTSGLETFITESQTSMSPSVWVWDGTVVAAFYPRASQLSGETFREALAAPEARRRPAPDGAWESLTTPDGAHRTKERLFRSLRRETDGYLARLDRVLSMALSRRLIRTPVTPNSITLVSLIVGLAGAALLASADYWITLLGAALLWVTCVLDGCDGEVARLKLRTSRLGARFDVITDNVVHLAVFVAIPVHVARTRPELEVWRPAAALVVGVLLSMFSVWWLILRTPQEGHDRVQLVYERIASRDFIYIVCFLAAIGRLEWFLWTAGIGATLFALSLWLMSPQAPAR
jgi:phosphatidylglycerophosphate synthase